MIQQLAEAAGRTVSRETLQLLERYESLLRAEAAKQNLISSSTLQSLWQRHILDSAQLVKFAPSTDTRWVDIGSGAGLPGLVIAILVDGPVLLVEPRRLRAEFLARVVTELGLETRVRIAPTKAEKVNETFDTITARAVADLDKLLKISTHLSTRKSLWVLPKGRNAQREVEEARRSWQGEFRVEPSLTDADSGIVVATEVKARGR